MISLKAIPKPTELTNKVVQELTARYKKEGSAVWRKKYIIDALLKRSANKCCYCECKIMEEGKYIEVEHFHPKSLYPDEVVAWKNLLPSCKRCNGKKGDHDTKKEPIIHPVRDNPKSHLTWKNYRLYSKTKLGDDTIGVIYLNDRNRLVRKRFDIGDKLMEALEGLLQSTIGYDDRTNFSTRSRNKIVGQLTNLMREGTRQSEFSATAATIILHEESYSNIKQLFLKNNLWNDEFIELEKAVEFCALDISQ